MRRWRIYAAGVAVALLLAPVEKTDVGELIPVEVLCVSARGNHIQVETDTGNLGIGGSLDMALKDLQETAEGAVFLETADYLIVTKETVGLLPELGKHLRPAAEVCLGAEGDTAAAEFLAAHPPGVTMNDIRAGRGTLPVLVRMEERYRIEG